jgi:hypothetical protein
MAILRYRYDEERIVKDNNFLDLFTSYKENEVLVSLDQIQRKEPVACTISMLQS